MSSFRQQSSIRISPPRYTNPAGLAVGEAVILDSTPVVNTAIQLAERDRTNAQYIDYLTKEKAKQTEKDFIEFSGKLEKITKLPTISGTNWADTEFLTKRGQELRDLIVKQLTDIASSDNYMLKYTALRKAQSMMDDFSGEVVKRKNAFEQRKAELQKIDPMINQTGKARYAFLSENTPTLDEKGNYIPLQYDSNYIVGEDLTGLLNKASEVAHSSQGVPLSAAKSGEPTVYNKNTFHQEVAKSYIVNGLYANLNTPNGIKYASTIGDLYNVFAKSKGMPEVDKSAFVDFNGINMPNINIVLKDPTFVEEMLLNRVPRKQDMETYTGNQSKIDENNKEYLDPSYFRVKMETPTVVNEKGGIVKSKSIVDIDIQNYQQRAVPQTKAFSPSQPFISLNVNEKGQNFTTLGSLPANERADLGNVRVLGIGEIPTAKIAKKGSGEQLGYVLLTNKQAEEKSHEMKKYYHLQFDVLDKDGKKIGTREGFTPAEGVNVKKEKTRFAKGARDILDKVISSIRSTK